LCVLLRKELAAQGSDARMHSSEAKSFSVDITVTNVTPIFLSRFVRRKIDSTYMYIIFFNQ